MGFAGSKGCSGADTEFEEGVAFFDIKSAAELGIKAGCHAASDGIVATSYL